MCARSTYIILFRKHSPKTNLFLSIFLNIAEKRANTWNTTRESRSEEFDLHRSVNPASHVINARMYVHTKYRDALHLRAIRLRFRRWISSDKLARGTYSHVTRTNLSAPRKNFTVKGSPVSLSVSIHLRRNPISIVHYI